MSAIRSTDRKNVIPQIRYGNFNALGKLLNQSLHNIDAFSSFNKTLRPLLRSQAAPRQTRIKPGEGTYRVAEMREDFLSVASHELKTPLTSLKLQVQLISRLAKSAETQQISPDKLQALAENADRQITRMTFLINNILDASGMRAGRLELESHEFDLAEAVRAEVDSFRKNPAYSELSISVYSEHPVVGRWDRARIGQIVRTFLLNAANYGLQKPIEISVTSVRGKAQLSVRDYGMGISKADQERIFKAFERGVSADHFGGLGLGLYIAHQIALAHQGTLSVKSKEGEGSVFVLRLPLS